MSSRLASTALAAVATLFSAAFLSAGSASAQPRPWYGGPPAEIHRAERPDRPHHWTPPPHYQWKPKPPQHHYYRPPPPPVYYVPPPPTCWWVKRQVWVDTYYGPELVWKNVKVCR